MVHHSSANAYFFLVTIWIQNINPEKYITFTVKKTTCLLDIDSMKLKLTNVLMGTIWSPFA